MVQNKRQINNKQLTPTELTTFQKENLKTKKAILEYKTACEANVCAILYKEPSKYLETKLQLNEFNDNVWRVYFALFDGVVVKEKKGTIDSIIAGIFLEHHPKLRAKYEEYGGWQTIEDAGAYVKVEAFDGYVAELRKWGAMLKLADHGWIDQSRMSEYSDMSAEDIYNELQVYINDTFINIDNDIKSYDIGDGIDALIDELDEGFAVGLPYYNMPMLTKETGGQYLGSITLLGGLSNSGKSSIVRTMTIPSIIKNNEKIVIMLNEDGIKKWQRELLVFVANNIFKRDVQKHIVRDGKFSSETREALVEAANWIKENTRNHTITIIPFQRYKTSNVIKIIKKYSGMGVKYFLLDTFKLDAGRVSDNSWIEMQQNMVEINDVVKPEANNLHILITFQLAKGSAMQRYYTQDNVGMAKNIVDPASTVLMLRNVYDDEYEGEKRELQCYRIEGTKSKVPVHLTKDKKYQVLFIIKNREGSANQYQIVLEHDMSRNILKEVGMCNVSIDW